MHDTSHRVRVVLKEDLGAIAGFGTLGESELLELSRNGLFREITTVVHNVRIGVYHEAYVLSRLELLLQIVHQRLCGLEVFLARYDVKRYVFDSAVRSLFVLLFVLFVQFLEVAVAHFNQTVSYAVVGFHGVLCAETVLTAVEGELCIQRVRFEQVLQQVRVFLLHVADANYLLPVQPIGLGLFEVRVLLCVCAFLVNSLQQTDHCLAAELTVLTGERTAATDHLVNVVADAQLAQLVFGNVHSDLFRLRAQRVIHHKHVPYLITDLAVHVFVKIATTGLDLIHFR